MKKYSVEEMMQEYYLAFGTDRTNRTNTDSNGIAFLFTKIVELTNENKYINQRLSKLESIILGKK